MVQRHPGFYWVVWTDLADFDLKVRMKVTRPDPLIGEWDGSHWWFARMEVYKFDCEVEVIGQMLSAPGQVAPDTQVSARAPRSAGASVG
jgi:hypothetical protein